MLSFSKAFRSHVGLLFKPSVVAGHPESGAPHLTAMMLEQGLRTLAIATRVLDDEMYNHWDAGYQEAASLLDDRDEAMDAQIAEVG